MEQLSGQDASYVYFESPTAPMHVGSVGIYDPSTAPGGRVRFKDILAHIEGRLHLAKTFRRRLLKVPGNFDHPYWVDDDQFDLEFHVRHLALPEPGDWRQLCIQVSRLHSRGLDMKRPLWEFYIIEGLDRIEGLPPGCFAMLSKMHHAAVDGVSGVEMLSAVHMLEPDAPPPDPPDQPWAPRPAPDLAELLIRAQLHNIAQPFRWIETIGGAIPAFNRVSQGVSARELSLDSLRPAVATRFQGRLSSHRVFEGRTIPFADVRAIRAHVPGTTINDVVLAIVGGALRRYLDHHGELPEETLTAAAPISVRGADDKGAMGNQVSAMVVDLGTNIADPVMRLHTVHASTLGSKALTNAVGARTLTSYSDVIPSGLASLGARLYSRLGLSARTAQFFNCIVSNVPGPRVPLYMAGAKLVTQHGLGPIFDGVGLMHPVYSYGEVMTIDFTADRAMMPDPAFYSECLQVSFEEMRAACAG